MKMQDLKKFDNHTNENRKMSLLQKENALDNIGKTIMGVKFHADLGDGKANKLKKEIKVLKSRIF